MATLFITQRFPPHAGAAARRLRHLAREFAASGPLFVIRRGEAGVEADAVKKTINIPARDLRRLVGTQQLTFSDSRKQGALTRLLLRMRQAYPFVYLIDDGGVDYRHRAFTAACKLIEQEGVTTMFSSFRPWSDHLVANKLKRKYPHLRWIADFRDLPVDPVRKDVWWPALQRKWGRGVVAEADEVWVVSDGQKKQFAGWHPRVRIRRNALLRLPPVPSSPRTERFTITYTGSLYPGLQTVRPLVKALTSLLAEESIDPHKLCLQYRGKDAGVFRKWTEELPEECLDVQPSIAPAAAQTMQRNATVLLLLNWSAPGYYGVLTAKLWDYLSTGRPVLALVNGPGDEELEGIIAGANAGAVFRTKEQGEVKAWLAGAYLAWLPAGRLKWAADLETLRIYLS